MVVLPLRPAQGPADAPLAEAAEAQPTAQEAALARREQAFDAATRVRAEAEREANALRDLYLQQRKRDDEFMQKIIALI